MDGEELTEQEAKYQEAKELATQPEPELPGKAVYADFIEGVATRDIALAHGAKPGATARVFETVGEDGEPTVNIAGEGKVVSGIGDILERGGYRVQEWHIKRPGDEVKEADKVRPALDELLKSVPTPILDSPGEFIRKALGLPVKAVAAGSEAIDEAASQIEEAAEALTEFNKGGKTDETNE